MKINRKMAMVVNQVKMDDEDTLDIAFWLAQPPSLRLAEVVRLRKNIFRGPTAFFLKKWRKWRIKEKCNVQTGFY